MKIEMGSEVHEIETKPLTIIVPSDTVFEKISCPKMIEIDMEMSLYHGRRVEKIHGDTIGFMQMVFEKIPDVRFDVESIKKSGLGMLHFFGRIDLTLKFIDMQVPFMWKYPEAGLHPGSQVNLSDVAIILSKRISEIP